MDRSGCVVCHCVQQRRRSRFGARRALIGAAATPANAVIRRPCPVSQAHHLSSTFAPGIGTGPAYAVGFKRGILRFEYPPDPKSQFAGSTWGGQKVLWVVKPSYHGALLIRGRRIDGPQALRFERGVDPPDELRLPIQPANLTGGWANYPSYTRLRAPGCYAYQVDGKAVSEVIVFRAVVSLNG